MFADCGGEKAARLGPWTISVRTGKILGSACSCKRLADDKKIECNFCRFTTELRFPHLPDMVFAENRLRLQHSGGGRVEFAPMDAMRKIDIERPPVQVACAEQWQESRSGSSEKKVKPFDWTYTTDYCGTLGGGFELTPTEERIDMEMLKKKENILFYEDVSLFEDELHDHGIASCSVKIRVMPSCWFVLLRYFLRVDDVLAKINDTRMFYALDSPSVIVEYTSRESPLPELNLPPYIYTNPNELSPRLPLVHQSLNKINIPV